MEANICEMCSTTRKEEIRTNESRLQSIVSCKRRKVVETVGEQKCEPKARDVKRVKTIQSRPTDAIDLTSPCGIDNETYRNETTAAFSPTVREVSADVYVSVSLSPPLFDEEDT